MKRALKWLAVILILTQTGTISAFAQTNGYGAGLGREDNINSNDYSTSSWDRFEFNYEFESGIDPKDELGRPTTTDTVPRATENENTRKNKDASLTPPPYGYFSGEFDTEQSNLYAIPNNPSAVRNSTDHTISSATYDTQSEGANMASIGTLTPTSLDYSGGSTSGNNVNVSYSNTSNSTQYFNNGLQTEAIAYADGSIGTLKIPELDITVKVYEGESLANMKKGVAHFEFSSNWDGNIALAAHNGGSAGYFENLKDLKKGDEFIYTTKYGKRTYELSYMQTISDTDYSLLGWSNENTLTMITCVKGQSNKRLAVVAALK